MNIAKFALFCIATAAPSLYAGSLLVSINTSSLPANTSGYLDFLFNNGGGSFDTITASLASFSAPGSTLNAGSVSTSGIVTGVLPSTVTIQNDNAEYLEALTFGSSLNFLLNFAETPSGTGSGSTFTISLLNSTLDGSFLTSDLNDGYIAEFDINNQGVVTPTTFTTDTGAPSVVSITATPEPGTMLLIGAGALGLALFRRKR